MLLQPFTRGNIEAMYSQLTYLTRKQEISMGQKIEVSVCSP